MDSNHGLQCFICNQFVEGQYTSLTKHFRNAHYMKTSSTSRVHLKCGQNGCNETFEYFAPFRHHLQVCDKIIIKNSVTNDDDFSGSLGVMPNDTDISEGTSQLNDCVMEEQERIKQDDESQQEDTQEFDLTKSLAKIFLKLRANHNATHAILDCIASDMKETFISFKNAVVNEVQDNTEWIDLIISSLSKVNSQYKRNVFFTTHFGLNKSTEIDMGGEKQQVMRSGGAEVDYATIPMFIPNTFHYLPLSRSLTSLFNNKKFRECYFSESPSSDGLVRGHRDSKHFNNHPLFSTNKFALRLQLFSDDVETTNALGSKTKKGGELCMFTFSILNLPPEINSRLSSIFPFAICRSDLIKKIGFDPILEALMREVEVLESENGMALDIDGLKEFKIQGTICSVCGDTKGMHELLGFMSCSADKLCRLCLISRKSIASCLTDDMIEKRTRANYDEALERILREGKPDPTTGMARGCALNKSMYWHVTENVIMDAMHDFLEGIVPFTIKLALREFKNQSMLSAEVLNKRIRLFKYARRDLPNKPSPKFTNENIKEERNYNTKQRASQNWCLIRMLPLLIGDLIKEGDSNFDTILHLLKVMDIIFLPQLFPAHMAILKFYIQELLEKYKKNYPCVSIINKGHHMVHYVEMMSTHGPATGTWCMRFEGFHNTIKSRAQSICNFKNLPKSIAEHCNTVLCHNLQDPNFCVARPIKFGPCKTYSHLDVTSMYSFDPMTIALFDIGPISITRWVTVGGFEYHVDSVVVLEDSSNTFDALPRFGVIETIFVQDTNSIFFRIATCRTLYFHDHFHGYVVEKETKCTVVSLNNLPELEPLNFLENFVQNDKTKFICPRHLI